MKFTVQKESYLNNKDFGQTAMLELCGLLGLTPDMASCAYGSLYADYCGHKISVKRERSLTEIRLRFWDFCCPEIKVKELSEKQVDNLKKKLKELLDRHTGWKRSREDREKISSRLYDLGIEDLNNRYFRFNGHQYRLLEDGTFECCDQFNARLTYVYYSEDLRTVKKSFFNAYNDYMEIRTAIDNDKILIAKHIGDIDAYFKS